MIKKIEIENYKSIDKLDFEIGQFNVFIGENGCGKTNILEAMAFASSSDDLENGKLLLKGVRITEPKFFRSGFDQKELSKNIRIALLDTEGHFIDVSFSNPNEPYSKWHVSSKIKSRNDNPNPILNDWNVEYEKYKTHTGNENVNMNEWIMDTNRRKDFDYLFSIRYPIDGTDIPILSYLLYAPENSFLRNYNSDTPYIQPLGTKGEGLLKINQGNKGRETRTIQRNY